MRPPVVKRHTSPVSGILSTFFMLTMPSSGTVNWLHFPVQVQTPRVCTTHVLRFCRHRSGDCSEAMRLSRVAQIEPEVRLPSSKRRHTPRRGRPTSLIFQPMSFLDGVAPLQPSTDRAMVGSL